MLNSEEYDNEEKEIINTNIYTILENYLYNTALYSINIAVMGGSSLLNMNKTETVFTMLKASLKGTALADRHVLIVALIAVVVIVLFLGFFFLLSLTASESSFAVICYQLTLSAFLLLTIDTDFEQYVIFDRMLLPFGILSLPFLLLMPFGTIISHLLAALGGGVLFFLLAVLTRGGIGGGDIKLIFVLGLWLGAWPLAAVILGGFFLGGISAALLMLLGKKGKHDFFAYGPYFSFVALAVTYIKP